MATAVASQEFNGTNERLARDSTTGPPKDVTYGFCLVCWWASDDVSGGSKYPISFGNDAGGQNTYFATRTNGGDLYVIIRVNEAAFDPEIAQAISNDTWYFTVTECASATDRRTFVNSVQQGNTDTTSQDIVSFKSLLEYTVLGSSHQPFDYFNAFPGRIAFARVFNKTLSEAEKTQLQWNPWSVVDDILWAPNLLIPASAVTDFKDYSGLGYDINDGTLPDISTDGPKVYHYGGG